MHQFWDTVCGVSWWPFVIVIILSMALVYYFQLKHDETMIKKLKKDCSFICQMTAIPVVFVVIVIFVDSYCIVPNAKSAFKDGFQSERTKCLIQRPDIIRELKKVLQPKSDHPGGYFLLEGLHGCGKTTVLKQIVADSASDVLYVPVGDNGDVSVGLYSALKIDAYCKSYWARLGSFVNLPSESCPKESSARLEYALHILETAATEIYFKDNHSPSVVFDNTAQILKRSDGLHIIHRLQDTAKRISDTRHLIFLFASSESSVPNIIRSRSSVSRLFRTITMVDIRDEEAVEYLTCMCPNATKGVITSAIRLVGGRFVDLLAASQIISDGDADKLKEILLQKLKASLATLPPQVKNVLYDVVRHILKSPRNKITRDEYKTLVSVLDTKDQDLIEIANIFWVKLDEVIFHSPITQHYFKTLFPSLTNSSTAWQLTFFNIIIMIVVLVILCKSLYVYILTLCNAHSYLYSVSL